MTAKTEGGTPRCDAWEAKYRGTLNVGDNPWQDWPDFARQLETELSAALVAKEAAERRLAAVEAETLEKAAKVCEKRAERRFEEHGITEPDTNASYYPKSKEFGDILDEEDADCAAAIRALAQKGGSHE